MNRSIERLGFVSRYPPTHCGVAEYTKMLISAIQSLNPRIKLYVFSTDESGKNARIDEMGVNVLPCYRRFETNYSNMLDELSEIGGVDVLHVQHEYGIFGLGRNIIDALLKAKEEGLARAVVITMHTVNHPFSEKKDALKFQSSLNSLDAIVVHSPLQEFELQIQGINPSKLNRIPHGTLINPYLGYTKRILSRSLNLNEEFRGMILAIPGFLRKDKGLDILIDALKILKDLRFTLIIAGELRDTELKDMFMDSLTYKIMLIDRYLSSDEILRVVALADAIVLPYRDKIGVYSVSGILHLSMGGLKPIIGSRTPRLVELYQFAPRLTVPPENPEDLAKKIRWLVKNYDYAVAYMTNLYGYAARTQWIRMAYRHLELYRSLLGT